MPKADLVRGTKICSNRNCALAGRPQPISAFHRNRAATDGLQWHCQACWRQMRKEKGYDRRAWLTGGKHTERARKAQKRFASHSLAALREAMRRKEPLYTELVLRHTAHIAGGLGQFAQMLMHYVETHGNPTQQARASLVLLELMKVNAELDAVRAEQRTSDDWSLLSDEEVDRRAEAAVAAAAQTRIDSLVAAGELCRVKKS